MLAQARLNNNTCPITLKVSIPVNFEFWWFGIKHFQKSKGHWYLIDVQHWDKNTHPFNYQMSFLIVIENVWPKNNQTAFHFPSWNKNKSEAVRVGGRLLTPRDIMQVCCCMWPVTQPSLPLDRINKGSSWPTHPKPTLSRPTALPKIKTQCIFSPSLSYIPTQRFQRAPSARWQILQESNRQEWTL